MHLLHYIKIVFQLAIYLVLQILTSNSDLGFPYLGGILLFPQNHRGIQPYELLFGFLVGFFVDMFLGCAGVHAFATVLVIYLNSWWMQFTRITYSRQYFWPSIRSMGWRKFSFWLLLCIIVHHGVVLGLEWYIYPLKLLYQLMLQGTATWGIIMLLQGIEYMIATRRA